MIDDHGVELACLHALGLLDRTGADELGHAASPGSALEALMRDLADAAAALAIAASTPPPAALRSRVLAAVDDPAEHRRNVNRPPARPRRGAAEVCRSTPGG